MGSETTLERAEHFGICKKQFGKKCQCSHLKLSALQKTLKKNDEKVKLHLDQKTYTENWHAYIL